MTRSGGRADTWQPHARAAVLGMPITHSLSPVLHRAAYDALGLDWDYRAIECDEIALADLLTRVRTEPGWVGLSLTMPLKTAVLALLDTIDTDAAAIGAVNTVVVRRGTDTGSDVRLDGFNTDVAGIAHAVTEVLGVGVAPGNPLVLGAGGTARAALGALAGLGAHRVDIAARRPPAAVPLVDLGVALGLAVTVHRWEPSGSGLAPRTGTAGFLGAAGPGGADLGGADPGGADFGAADLGAADVVIATTPAGATDDLARFPWPASTGLVELLYHPWPTRLAAAAQAAGAAVAGGLVMLAAQAVGQVRLFTGAEVDVGLLLDEGQRALSAREPGRTVR